MRLHKPALYARQPERDSYDNALAGTINGLYKAALILPPAEAETNYYQQLSEQAIPA